MKGEGFGYRFPIRRSEAAIGMPIRGFGPCYRACARYARALIQR